MPKPEPYSTKKRVFEIPVEWAESRPATLRVSGGIPDIAFRAVPTAILSGMEGGAREAMDSYESYQQGKIDGDEYASRIFRSGAGSTLAGGAKAFAAFGLQEGMKLISDKWGRAVLKRFSRSHAATFVAFGIVDQGLSTYKWYNGEISDSEMKIQSAENAGGAGGAVGGAVIGAAAGSFVPGLGTAFGAIFGSYIGGYFGAKGAKNLGENWFTDSNADNA
jgi:phage tail tape-measure protein